ncbi:MAG: tyrosine-type recombinase/integrase [Actinomycetales bacterium]|nr:tyrosine-type recombinase/integrase [Actinomycetales bacterium]
MARKRDFGSIRLLPSGRFQARYSLNDAQILAPRTFASRREASDWLATQQATVARDGWIDPSQGNVSLSQYTREWLDRRPDLSPSTRVLYADIIRRFIVETTTADSVTVTNPRLGEMSLRQISPSHVSAWTHWVRAVSAAGAIAKQTVTPGSTRETKLLRDWARANGYPVAETGRLPARLREDWVSQGSPGLPPLQIEGAGQTQSAQAYRLLSAVFRTAVDEGRISRTPCTQSGAGTVRHARRPVLNVDQVEALADGMPSRYRASIYLATFSGLRAGEIFALQRKHVDLASGTVDVRQALKRGSAGAVHVGPPKSAAGYRKVHLPEHVRALLAAHMEQHTSPGAEALVFGTRNGTPLRSSNRSAMFRRTADRIGLKDVHFHDLRHTGATWASEQGAGIAQLMRRLGHSTPRAALIYQHARDDADRILAERLDTFAPERGGSLAV